MQNTWSGVVLSDSSSAEMIITFGKSNTALIIDQLCKQYIKQKCCKYVWVLEC